MLLLHLHSDERQRVIQGPERRQRAVARRLVRRAALDEAVSAQGW